MQLSQPTIGIHRPLLASGSTPGMAYLQHFQLSPLKFTAYQPLITYQNLISSAVAPIQPQHILPYALQSFLGVTARRFPSRETLGKTARQTPRADRSAKLLLTPQVISIEDWEIESTGTDLLPVIMPEIAASNLEQPAGEVLFDQATIADHDFASPSAGKFIEMIESDHALSGLPSAKPAKTVPQGKTARKSASNAAKRSKKSAQPKGVNGSKQAEKLSSLESIASSNLNAAQATDASELQQSQVEQQPAPDSHPHQRTKTHRQKRSSKSSRKFFQGVSDQSRESPQFIENLSPENSPEQFANRSPDQPDQLIQPLPKAVSTASQILTPDPEVDPVKPVQPVEGAEALADRSASPQPDPTASEPGLNPPLNVVQPLELEKISETKASGIDIYSPPDRSIVQSQLQSQVQSQVQSQIVEDETKTAKQSLKGLPPAEKLNPHHAASPALSQAEPDSGNLEASVPASVLPAGLSDVTIPPLPVTYSTSSVQGFSIGGQVTPGQAPASQSIAPSDTVPAMLTPGEFVINAQDAQKHLPLLHHLNQGGDLDNAPIPPATAPSADSDSRAARIPAATPRATQSPQRIKHQGHTQSGIAAMASADLHSLFSGTTRSMLLQAIALESAESEAGIAYSRPAIVHRSLSPAASPEPAPRSFMPLPERWNSVEDLLGTQAALGAAQGEMPFADTAAIALPAIVHQSTVQGFVAGGQVSPSPAAASETAILPAADQRTAPEQKEHSVMENLAQEIYRRLQFRLEIERERQGSYRGRLPW